jgi:TolB-like protein
MITRVFFIRLGNTNRVSLVDRNVVDRVLREHSFQAGDWSNQQKTAELGEALNADWIVRGELERFGTNILVTVQFYDIRTFRFMGGSDILLTNAEEAMEKMDPLVNRLVETIAANPTSTSQRQARNTNTSAYYGTWIFHGQSGFSTTLNVEANRIIHRNNDGWHFVISNCTWTEANNININTLIDYPRGFKISGAITAITSGSARMYSTIYLFLHRSDSNRIYLYYTPDSASEIQDGEGRGPFAKIQ